MAKKSVESDKIEILGTVVRNRSYVYEKTERRLNSGNRCYHAGSNVIDLPVKIQNIQNCKCSGSLYGYEYRLSLQWKNVDRECLRAGCLAAIFGPKGEEVTCNLEKNS